MAYVESVVYAIFRAPVEILMFIGGGLDFLEVVRLFPVPVWE